ncbi:MAG TPA: uroporphyrinogen-III synthase [Rhizomicrobium sp.]
MRVLLTRSLAESEQLAALLRSRGHHVVLSPMMDIRFLEGAPLTLGGIQAIVVTSANGIDALARRTPVRDTPVFAVGPQTSDAARAAGFANVEQGGGDSTALTEAVRGSAHPNRGALLLAAGRERRGEVESGLAAAGFTVRVEELYAAVEIPHLSVAGAKALSEGAIDAVMLFSPRSARLFVQQVLAAKLGPRCERVIALCISEATAAELGGLNFAARHVSHRPDRQGMLQLLDNAAVHLPTR